MSATNMPELKIAELLVLGWARMTNTKVCGTDQSWLSPYLYKETMEIHYTLQSGVDSTKNDL